MNGAVIEIHCIPMIRRGARNSDSEIAMDTLELAKYWYFNIVKGNKLEE